LLWRLDQSLLHPNPSGSRGTSRSTQQRGPHYSPVSQALRWGNLGSSWLLEVLRKESSRWHWWIATSAHMSVNERTGDKPPVPHAAIRSASAWRTSFSLFSTWNPQ